MTDDKKLRPDTITTHAGRDPQRFDGVVNTPVFRASTVLFPDVESYERRDPDDYKVMRYGIYGTPTTFALEEAVAQLEGGHAAVALPSGLAAIVAALAAFAHAGAHILIADSVYQPTRNFCDKRLRGLGVEIEYYDPAIGAAIAGLIRPNTTAVFCESPGSLTLRNAGHSRDRGGGARKRRRGARRHHLGHAVFFSRVRARRRHLDPRRHQVHLRAFGRDDGHRRHQRTVLAQAAPRGRRLRLLREPGRLLSRAARPAHHRRAHARSSSRARCGSRAGCRRGRKSCACSTRRSKAIRATRSGSAISAARPRCSAWFSSRRANAAVAALIDALQLFGIGSSWGGFESLAIRADPGKYRSATRWNPGGPLLRLHIGLEDPDDLIADLEQGLARKCGEQADRPAALRV